jgi:mitochondrial fission protein ELM1
MMDKKGPRIWVLLGQRKGDNNQLLVLAHALNLPFETRSMRYNILRKVPKQLLDHQLVSVRPSARKWLEPPWPDMVIGIGHRSVPVARYIRIASGGRTKLVQLGNPRIHPRNFDLVITTPQYGVEKHSNVVRLPLAMDSPHPPSPMTEDEVAFFGPLERPHRLLILGGPNKHWFVSADDATQAATSLIRRCAKHGGTLIGVGSPRTEVEVLNAVKTAISNTRHRFVSGPTPSYRALLEDADEIHVTADSVSMLSEAVFTGKPVGMIPVRLSPRGVIARALCDAGLAKPPRPNLQAVWASLKANRLVGTLNTPRAGQAQNPVSKAVSAVLELLNRD